MNKELEMKKEIIINRIIDFSFVLGIILVLFPHYSKDYIPSFLFPFFWIGQSIIHLSFLCFFFILSAASFFEKGV